MVPPAELEISSHPHSTGCPPSTIATKETAGRKFKSLVRSSTFSCALSARSAVSEMAVRQVLANTALFHLDIWTV
jgi:hypothetical protein